MTKEEWFTKAQELYDEFHEKQSEQTRVSNSFTNKIATHEEWYEYRAAYKAFDDVKKRVDEHHRLGRQMDSNSD